MRWLGWYREIWLVDFEFHQPNGETPEPLCMVARELRTGRTIRIWRDELLKLRVSPISIGPDVLFVAYFASAELGCYLTLGWPLPTRILDLFCEFRCLTNGLELPCGNGLLGALTYFGIDGIAAAEKLEMRELAMRGGEYSSAERAALIDYCESDVLALNKLFSAMMSRIDLPRALLRGRYMVAVAKMERTGTPLDVVTLQSLRKNWSAIQGHVVREIDADFGFYSTDETGAHFSIDRFAPWLSSHDIAWPYLPSGRLDFNDDTFRDMVKIHPVLAPMRELRQTLSAMRLFSDLQVGRDGRNRCLLSPFASKTARNQPSNSKFIFGPSCWLRSLIRPEPGYSLAYIDWSQQEFGIAAGLSGDAVMIESYLSGDPYLMFAKQANAVPAHATKKSHSFERELFKACCLAVQYLMGSLSLALRIGRPEPYARELLRLHRATYRRFWQWSDSAVTHAMLNGSLNTVFGWTSRAGIGANTRSFANFPMQANGAEMLRLACCLATERGVAVCAPVHDALLVEGPTESMEEIIATTQAAMAEASRVVLQRLELRSDVKIVTYPERYIDPRGEVMWEKVMQILSERESTTVDALGYCVSRE